MLQTLMSYAEFEAWEATQPDKYEFYLGEVFAMTGERAANITVRANLTAALVTHLRHTTCRVMPGDYKVRVRDEASFYPDLIVTCESQYSGRDLYTASPEIVIEILSDSTARFDRTSKSEMYAKLSSLREYVLIDPEKRTVEVRVRRADGTFDRYDQTSGGTLAIERIDFSLSLEELFRLVEPRLDRLSE